MLDLGKYVSRSIVVTEHFYQKRVMIRFGHIFYLKGFNFESESIVDKTVGATEVRVKISTFKENFFSLISFFCETNGFFISNTFLQLSPSVA